MSGEQTITRLMNGSPYIYQILKNELQVSEQELAGVKDAKSLKSLLRRTMHRTAKNNDADEHASKDVDAMFAGFWYLHLEHGLRPPKNFAAALRDWKGLQLKRANLKPDASEAQWKQVVQRLLQGQTPVSAADTSSSASLASATRATRRSRSAEPKHSVRENSPKREASAETKTAGRPPKAKSSRVTVVKSVPAVPKQRQRSRSPRGQEATASPRHAPADRPTPPWRKPQPSWRDEEPVHFVGATAKSGRFSGTTAKSGRTTARRGHASHVTPHSKALSGDALHENKGSEGGAEADTARASAVPPPPMRPHERAQAMAKDNRAMADNERELQKRNSEQAAYEAARGHHALAARFAYVAELYGKRAELYGKRAELYTKISQQKLAEDSSQQKQTHSGHRHQRSEYTEQTYTAPRHDHTVDSSYIPPPYAQMTPGQQSLHEMLQPTRLGMPSSERPPHPEHGHLYLAALANENEDEVGPSIIFSGHQEDLHDKEILEAQKIIDDCEKRIARSEGWEKRINAPGALSQYIAAQKNIIHIQEHRRKNPAIYHKAWWTNRREQLQQYRWQKKHGKDQAAAATSLDMHDQNTLAGRLIKAEERRGDAAASSGPAAETQTKKPNQIFQQPFHPASMVQMAHQQAEDKEAYQEERYKTAKEEENEYKHAPGMALPVQPEPEPISVPIDQRHPDQLDPRRRPRDFLAIPLESDDETEESDYDPFR
jgi:hypothetical protein